MRVVPLEAGYDEIAHESVGTILGGGAPRWRARRRHGELRDAQRARWALAVDYPWFAWNDVSPPPTEFQLRYRLDDGPWHDRFVSETDEHAFASDPDEGPVLPRGGPRARPGAVSIARARGSPSAFPLP